jgi:cytochrome b561
MDATTVMPRPATTGRVPAGLLYGLRIAVTAQAAAVLVAASFAGQAVESGAMSETHVMAGMVVHLVALVQIVLAVLVWRPGRGAGRPAQASVVLFVAGGLQHVPWWPAAHLPTGVLLVGLVAAVLIWAWSPAAARRR